MVVYINTCIPSKPNLVVNMEILQVKCKAQKITKLIHNYT